MGFSRSNVRWMLLGLAIFVVCGGLAFRLLLDRLEPDLPVGQPLPDAVLTDAGGQPLALSNLKGSVVLLEFWSST